MSRDFGREETLILKEKKLKFRILGQPVKQEKIYELENNQVVLALTPYDLKSCNHPDIVDVTCN